MFWRGCPPQGPLENVEIDFLTFVIGEYYCTTKLLNFYLKKCFSDFQQKFKTNIYLLICTEFCKFLFLVIIFSEGSFPFLILLMFPCCTFNFLLLVCIGASFLKIQHNYCCVICLSKCMHNI